MLALALFLVSVPAFPGAEGAGASATGGRGGQVYRVTNVNVSGPGSLADAVSQPNRIIVFTVSGTIDLTGRKKKIELAQPNITIAGQSAPGEGICIRGGALRISAGNIIIRHIRVRRGFNEVGDMGDAVDLKGHFENVMLDHVSTSWATDENLTLTNANRVTAQFSIAAEGLDYFNPNQSPNRHSEGSLFGSHTPGGYMTIHHTLYAQNRLRNARTTAGGDPPPELDFRNNVIYDAKELTTHTGSEPVHLNLVNNYYKNGPSTGVEDASAKSVIFTFVKQQPYRLYAEGNHIEGNPGWSADNWQAVRYHSGVIENARAARAFLTPAVTTETALAAFETVLEHAGATLPARDAVDLRIVRDVRRGTGAVINYETDIPEPGRWQDYRTLPAPADSDGDGIPDYWEKQFGLEPASPADAMKTTAGGYANIEHYLNNSDPRGSTTPIVYISGNGRAYRVGNVPGALRVHRTGAADKPLVVRLTARVVTIPAGAAWLDIPVPPGAENLGQIAAGTGYHIGCPSQALVAVVDGAPPTPADIGKIDPDGGVSAEVRRLGEANMEQHKKDKPLKKARKKTQAKAPPPVRPAQAESVAKEAVSRGRSVR